MRTGRTSRRVVERGHNRSRVRLCALALVACLATAAAQPVPSGTRQPMQQGQRAGGGQRPVQRFWQSQPNNAGPNATRGEHLQQWMQQHNQLSTQQQQQALQHEAGFRQLPQETQQRMLNRLDRLNSMPPQQRARVLERSEQMERLNPQQRGQVRSAMGQLGALPQDRRRAVSRSFRELRDLPPQQRNQLLNSPEYHQQFTDEERGTLGNLLAVSPMLPRQ
jgi:DNA-directed RNA polymerase subunit F